MAAGNMLEQPGVAVNVTHRRDASTLNILILVKLLADVMHDASCMCSATVPSIACEGVGASVSMWCLMGAVAVVRCAPT